MEGGGEGEDCFPNLNQINQANAKDLNARV